MLLNENIMVDQLTTYCVIGSSVSEGSSKEYLVCKKDGMMWIPFQKLVEAEKGERGQKKRKLVVDDDDDSDDGGDERVGVDKFQVCEKYSSREVALTTHAEATIISGPKSVADRGKIGEGLQRWSWEIQWKDSGLIEKIDTALAIAGMKHFTEVISARDDTSDDEDALEDSDNYEAQGGGDDMDDCTDADTSTTSARSVVTPACARSSVTASTLASTMPRVPSVTPAAGASSKVTRKEGTRGSRNKVPKSQQSRSIVSFFTPNNKRTVEETEQPDNAKKLRISN
jgi:hypothetical protein